MKIQWRRLQLPFDISNIYIWSLVTAEIDQICKQTVTISVFWALKALFVTEKYLVINQYDWKFIEEGSNFHLTYQTLIFDHWWLQESIKLVKKQSQYLTFGQFLQSPVIRYQCLIYQMNAGLSFNKFLMILNYKKTFLNNKQRLYSPNDRNHYCFFTNLINCYSHQWSDINVW